MAETTREALLYRRVLFCTDFSENADFAFEYAIDAVSRRAGSELHLLHVIPEPEAQFWKTYIYEVDDVDDKARHDLDERIDGSYRHRLPAGMDMQVHIRVGRDSEQILAFAEQQKIDLIVMGRHGSSSLGTLLFGEVAERVARKAACCVLIVPLSYRDRIESDDRD
jgi:nucleotide-binding universal stress UspA family protein